MILRLIVAAILLYLLYRITKRLFLPSGKKVKPLPDVKQGGNKGEELVEDPVCHTYVPLSEAHTLDVEGKTVHFCSMKCLEQYEKQRKNNREEA